MRLIDADAIIEKHCEGCSEDIRSGCKTDPVCATLMWFEEAPTIDAVPKDQHLARCKEMYEQGKFDALAEAVPVVRCKDCKHWNEFMNGQNGKMFGDCKLVGKFRNEDDFCSYGERKDGDA